MALSSIKEALQKAGFLKGDGTRNEYQYNYDPASQEYTQTSGPGMKKGGKVSSASKRADGIAIRGKTRA